MWRKVNKWGCLVIVMGFVQFIHHEGMHVLVKLYLVEANLLLTIFSAELYLLAFHLLLGTDSEIIEFAIGKKYVFVYSAGLLPPYFLAHI